MNRLLWLALILLWIIAGYVYLTKKDELPGAGIKAKDDIIFLNNN